MPLFIVRHQHAADGCPAQDPLMGASLLNHLSRPNVRKFGLHIQGEAVVHGEHTMYMIVEAADEERLREFMQPFQMAGSLDIYPASTCVRTVASGGCAAPMPVSADVPTLDPEEACQQAIDAGMVMHRAHPLNCETSIPALVGGVVMPNARFYMRNNFHMPNLDAATFRLAIGGLVERSQSFTVRDLQNMRSKTQVVTLECAGNGRALFDRPTEGETWGLGAVAGVRHERRATARRAWISTASHRSALVRGGIGHVVERDRAHRPDVHRPLPGRLNGRFSNDEDAARSGKAVDPARPNRTSLAARYSSDILRHSP